MCKDVDQSPASVLSYPDSRVELTCSHSIKSYDTILWYQRSGGDTQLKLVAYMYYRTPKTEDPFTNAFNVSGDGENIATLHIQCSKQAQVTAMYYCAASITQCCRSSALCTITFLWVYSTCTDQLGSHSSAHHYTSHSISLCLLLGCLSRRLTGDQNMLF